MFMLTMLAADGHPIAFVLILGMIAIMAWSICYTFWKRRRQRLLRNARRKKSRRRNRRRHCCACAHR